MSQTLATTESVVLESIGQPRPLLVTVKQAAAILSLSRSSIYLLVEAGTLTPLHIGRSVRFSMDDLEAFVANLKDGDEAELSTSF